MTAALQETEKGNMAPLKVVCEDMNKLIKMAVKMLQGHSVAEREKVDPDDTSSPTASASTTEEPYPHRTRDMAGSVPVTHDQASRLRSVLLILNSHHQRAVEMTQFEGGGDEDGGKGHLNSFFWKNRLHWMWSQSEKMCHMTTLGAQLSYGFHYVGSSSRVVLTPSTERALVFLLRAVHQGTNTLMNGPEVSTVKGLHRCVYDSHTYMCSSSCVCVNLYTDQW